MIIYSKDDLIDLLQDNEDLSEEQTNAICALSTDQDEETRSIVAELLCNSPFPSAEEVLLQLSMDTDELVRVNACDSLYNSSNPDCLTHLIKIVESDPGYMVRGYALMSYWDIYKNINGENEMALQLPSMKELYSRETEQWVRTIFLKFLYLCGDQDAWQKILECLKDKDYHIRNLAAGILVELATLENIDEIQKAAEAVIEQEDAVSVKEKLEGILQFDKSMMDLLEK